MTVAAACAFLPAPLAQVPAGYPADYQKIIDAAKKEGKLVIYGATDSKATQPLIKDFSALYPGITVEYNDMNSTEVYNRFISEVAAGGNTADVMWSSAMDLQMRLASDGYALQYKSVEASRFPAGPCGMTRLTAPPSSRPPSSTTSAWSMPRKCRRTTPTSPS
jgi:iron(III) transport system substrate-binding protein